MPSLRSDLYSNAGSEIQREEREYILLDIRMPKIDGIELLERIRQLSNDITGINPENPKH